MSLTAKRGTKPVHYPKDKAKFGFDNEVSEIFTNMAERSIPNFRLAHKTHAAMVSPWMTQPIVQILDVGASRGDFLKELIEKYGQIGFQRGKHQYTAVDNSADMCGHLKLDFPFANIRCADIADDFLDNYSPRFDIVCAHYVLQFVPPEKQEAALRRLMRLVRPGGIFIYGHKGSHSGELGVLAHEEYIEFRLNNGYTREEIDAKTAALRGSMWPMSDIKVMNMARENFSEVQETSRFLMFSTFIAIK